MGLSTLSDCESWKILKLQKCLNLTYADVSAGRYFNTVTGYTTEILLPAKTDFSLVQQFQYCCGSHPASYAGGTEFKRSECEADHYNPSCGNYTF